MDFLFFSSRLTLSYTPFAMPFFRGRGPAASGIPPLGKDISFAGGTTRNDETRRAMRVDLPDIHSFDLLSHPSLRSQIVPLPTTLFPCLNFILFFCGRNVFLATLEANFREG
ncbi:hypothetical protein ARMGADRAFT_180882 [Armillaria gallica]|uniref:Uncharacterized protein n=1 Tax=Armillaria gallica TaxID=47427 RepID=A0A2H3DXK6_ARMGA|nr:hypothetical protein ARMGADRAFT_180882 [Armillaria gallica]